jgi:hypothetical protein
MVRKFPPVPPADCDHPTTVAPLWPVWECPGCRTSVSFEFADLGDPGFSEGGPGFSEGAPEKPTPSTPPEGGDPFTFPPDHLFGGPEDLQALLQHLDGDPRHRTWPHGRMAPDDDGSTHLALALDPQHRVIRLQFGGPVTWVGFDLASASSFLVGLTNLVEQLAALEEASGA